MTRKETNVQIKISTGEKRKKTETDDNAKIFRRKMRM